MVRKAEQNSWPEVASMADSARIQEPAINPGSMTSEVNAKNSHLRVFIGIGPSAASYSILVQPRQSPSDLPIPVAAERPLKPGIGD
jgi:hypothetical protein